MERKTFRFHLLWVVALVAGMLVSSCTREVEEVPAISLSAYSVTVAPASDTVVFSIRANVEFTVEVNDDWVHLLDSTRTIFGTDTRQLVFAVDANTNFDARWSDIIVKYGTRERKLSIVQNGLSSEITVSREEFNIGWRGGSLQFDVVSNVDFQVTCSENWITLGESGSSTSQTFEKGTQRVYANVSQSNEYEERSTVITITGGDGLKAEVSVKQGGEGQLIISTKEYNIGYYERDLSVSITSNFDYEVQMPDDADWLTLVAPAATRGLQQNVLQLHVAENTAFDSRTATVKVYDKLNEALSDEIIVTQGQKDTIDIATKSYVIDELGGDITVDLQSNLTVEAQVADEWIALKSDESDEVATTRGLEPSSFDFTIAPLPDDELVRETTITIASATNNVKEQVTVTQQRALYFAEDSVEINLGSEVKLVATNLTEQGITWKSSNTAVATVTGDGLVKGITRGKATITATTADGLHTRDCQVVVKDITDYIVARCDANVSYNYDLIQWGGTLTFRFLNNSYGSVQLDSLTITCGSDEPQTIEYGGDVRASSNYSYTYTAPFTGLHLPVKCVFFYRFNDQAYTVETIYKGEEEE